jgi:hypothetical protein
MSEFTFKIIKKIGVLSMTASGWAPPPSLRDTSPKSDVISLIVSMIL